MYIYFLESAENGHIKIGRAQSLDDRLRTLRASSGSGLKLLCYLEITKQAAAFERELHARFWRDRIRGEWFRPSLDLLGYVDLLHQMIAYS